MSVAREPRNGRVNRYGSMGMELEPRHRTFGLGLNQVWRLALRLSANNDGYIYTC